MNESNKTEAADVRTFCMNWGTVVGLLCCCSFLCSMYGFRHPLLGQMSNLLGLGALFVAGRSIRLFRSEADAVTFGRACRMAVSIYFYAILLTALIQYAYFAYLDGGQLVTQVQQLLAVPEYRLWLEQVAEGEDVDALTAQVLSILQRPVQATMQLMWMNCLLGLLLTPITALFGITGHPGKASKKAPKN